MTEQQKKTAGIAITSLVLGIIGLLTIWLCGLGALFAIPAVICGHIGSARIKKSGGTLAGSGLALAGLITGYISVALLVLLIPLSIMSSIALPAFANARGKAIEMSCKNNLRQIEAAVEQYALDNANKVAPNIAALVGPAAYIKDTPVCKKGGVYSLPTKLGDKPACSVHGTL